MSLPRLAHRAPSHLTTTTLCLRTRAARTFTTTPILPATPLPPRRVIPDSELEENFLKGSGPGGQKINKTSSAVQLKHLPTGIVVKCQDTRSRSQNRKLARRILGERIEELELGEEARTRVKAREKSKRKESAEKKKRRKYRALAAKKEKEKDGDVSGGWPSGEKENAAGAIDPVDDTAAVRAFGIWGQVDRMEEQVNGEVDKKEGKSNRRRKKDMIEGGVVPAHEDDGSKA